MKLFQNLTSGFRGEEFSKNFSSPHREKGLPPHSGHFQRIKISLTILEKDHPRNNPVKLFHILSSDFGEEDFLRISSCPYSTKSPPPSPHVGHVFRRIKISRTIFEKGHPRNISVKLIQNRTMGFKEDFLRISSYPYSAKHLPSPWRPCFSTDQNFANNF